MALSPSASYRKQGASIKSPAGINPVSAPHHHREQADRLRELAEMQKNQTVREDLLRLADQYDRLANSVAGQR